MNEALNHLTAAEYFKPFQPISDQEDIFDNIKNEEILPLLEEHNPDLNCSVTIYDPETSKRPTSSLRASLLKEFPQVVHRLVPVFNEVLNTGGFLTYSKMWGKGNIDKEFEDSSVVFSGGLLNGLEKHVAYQTFWNVQLSDILFPILHYSNLNERYTAAIFSRNLNEQDIARLPDHSNTQKIAKNLMNIFLEKNSDITIVSHMFHSQTYMRVHPLPVSIYYVIPGDFGKEFADCMQTTPWYMETMSEMVLAQAETELHPRRKLRMPSINFYSLYKNDPEQTLLFEPSGTEHILLSASFSSK